MVRGAFPAGFRVRLPRQGSAPLPRDGGALRRRAAGPWSACSRVRRVVRARYGDEDISATYRLKAELFERTNIMVPPRDT